MPKSQCPILPAVIIAFLAAGSGTALAQDAVRLEIIRQGVVGGAPPTLIVHPQVGIDDLAISVSCGGASAQHNGTAELAVPIALPLAALQGTHDCSGELSLKLADGTTGEMPLSFQIEVVPAVVLTASREDLDLSAGRLIVRGDRPLRSAWVVLSGEHGELLTSDVAAAVAGAADGAVELRWLPPSDEVLRMEVVAEDAAGFASRLELFPWSYAVPHEEVVFESGKTDIRDSEIPALQGAWADIQTVVSRYGQVAPVHLYVAGYTDTVGSDTSNQRLSEARARTIAGWFAQQGFQGEIHYQGLGERGLAVPTPDETDEERNRRADYIVAAQAPPITERLPQARWVPLR